VQASSCPDRGTSRCVTTGRVRHQPLIGPASARVPSFPAVPFLSMARLRWLWLNCRNSRQSPKYGPDPTSHDRSRRPPWWPAVYPVSISQARRLSPDAFRVDDAPLSWDVHGRCGFATGFADSSRD